MFSFHSVPLYHTIRLRWTPLAVLLFLAYQPQIAGFVRRNFSRARPPGNRCKVSVTSATTSATARIPTCPILDDIPSQFQVLFNAAANATSLRGADTSNQGHDSFRYEWGTWVVEESLTYLMDQCNTVTLQSGVFEKLLVRDDGGNNHHDDVHPETEAAMNKNRRYRVASGQDWDVLLHVLPEQSKWQGRWPTGSWSILKPLTGMAQIWALSGRDLNKKGTVRSLRGGSDGDMASGGGSHGENCIKYVGGPLRCYQGAYGKTVLLEVVVRPPIGRDNQPPEVIDTLPIALQETFAIVHPTPESTADGTELDDKTTLSTASTPASLLANLNKKRGISFDAVGGLDAQLMAIARRVLASRANPQAARKLGVSHVRGILLSGPPGCGKTLLARELARILGARKPQIVNGPEILDKYIGEAEKKVRELFAPAELEYQISGDDSALHIIILDEMDAIARKRGTMTADTTGVRDSVVNQLLAKMDGVKEASNILVIGLTNRPELPGRLEVQLRVELPDLLGRRDILRIHTRKMRETDGLSKEAADLIEDAGDCGIAARTEHFSGAELAGLVRSAASFALTRSLETESTGLEDELVTVSDLEKALQEVRPALGKQDELLKMRFPLGISPCSPAIERIMRDLERFTAPISCATPRLQSMLLVGAGRNGGAGVTALSAWAASIASANGSADYTRFITALDLLTGAGDAGEDARASALVERFAEAREMPHSLLVLDDVDQLCAGSGPSGYSSVMLSTLRALLRSPPPSGSMAKAGGQSSSKIGRGRTINIIAATSRSDAACMVLKEIFDETVVVPLLQDKQSVRKLLGDSLPSESAIVNVNAMADLIIEQLQQVGCKTVLRLAERAVASAALAEHDGENLEHAQLDALDLILRDLVGDQATAGNLCELF